MYVHVDVLIVGVGVEFNAPLDTVFISEAVLIEAGPRIKAGVSLNCTNRGRGLVFKELRVGLQHTGTVQGRAFQFGQKKFRFDSILATEWIFFVSIRFANLINLPLVH